MEKVITAEWENANIFVVTFEEKPTTKRFELKGVTEQVIVEYTKDKNSWNASKIYLDENGGVIDLADDFSPYYQAMYIGVAQSEIKGKSNAWEQIVVEDDYSTYDSLIDRIKDYYAPCDMTKANEIEDLFNARFMAFLKECDEKYGMSWKR